MLRAPRQPSASLWQGTQASCQQLTGAPWEGDPPMVVALADTMTSSSRETPSQNHAAPQLPDLQNLQRKSLMSKLLHLGLC